MNGKGMVTMTEYDEAMERFKQAVSDMAEKLQPVIQTMAEMVAETMKQIRPVLKALMGGFTYYCKHYGNSRVVHLALHAKKARVRNKNRNRLFNDYLKALQRGVV